MEADQAERCQLLGAGQVAEVVAVVALAGGAGTALDEGAAVALPAGLAQIEAEAGLRARGEGDAVAGEAGRDRAVEYVEAERDAGEQVVDLADPEQVLGRRLGQQRRGEGEHLAHLRLVAPQGAADRQAVKCGLRDRLRGVAPKVLVDPALDDPEHGLAPRPILLMPPEAAIEPSMRPLRRSSRVIPLGVKRSALVKGQCDVRPQLRLHLHRDLGRDEQRGPVPVGAKPNPLLLDRDSRPRPSPLPPTPLDLVSHPPVGE